MSATKPEIYKALSDALMQLEAWLTCSEWNPLEKATAADWIVFHRCASVLSKKDRSEFWKGEYDDL